MMRHIIQGHLGATAKLGTFSPKNYNIRASIFLVVKIV